MWVIEFSKGMSFDVGLFAFCVGLYIFATLLSVKIQDPIKKKEAQTLLEIKNLVINGNNKIDTLIDLENARNSAHR